MIDLKVEVEVEPLVQTLYEVSEEGRKETVQQLETAAEMIRDEAKVLCPVNTGSLQRSIRIWRREAMDTLASVGVSAGGYIVNPKTGRTVDYAHHVEYGTSRMIARPFMRPAFEMVKPLIIAIVSQAWRRVMEAKTHG